MSKFSRSSNLISPDVFRFARDYTANETRMRARSAHGTKEIFLRIFHGFFVFRWTRASERRSRANSRVKMKYAANPNEARVSNFSRQLWARGIRGVADHNGIHNGMPLYRFLESTARFFPSAIAAIAYAIQGTPRAARWVCSTLIHASTHAWEIQDVRIHASRKCIDSSAERDSGQILSAEWSAL